MVANVHECADVQEWLNWMERFRDVFSYRLVMIRQEWTRRIEYANIKIQQPENGELLSVFAFTFLFFVFFLRKCF